MTSFKFDVTGQRFQDIISGNLSYVTVPKKLFFGGQVGDELYLRELSYAMGIFPLRYTGREILVRVTHVATDFTMKGLREDSLGLSFKLKAAQLDMQWQELPAHDREGGEHHGQ